MVALSHCSAAGHRYSPNELSSTSCFTRQYASSSFFAISAMEFRCCAIIPLLRASCEERTFSTSFFTCRFAEGARVIPYLDPEPR